MNKKLSLIFTQEEWIIEVRKLITTEFPKITVGDIVAIFKVDSNQLETLHFAYLQGKTPTQAYVDLKKVHGPALGITALKS